MIIKSETYPQLRVCDVDVKFVDGQAEVTDPAKIAFLSGLAGLGVVVPKAEPKPEGTPPAGDGTASNPAGGENAGGDEGSSDGGDSERVDGDDHVKVDPDDRELWDEAKLRAFAEEKNIDLGKVRNVEKIRERITEALAAQ